MVGAAWNALGAGGAVPHTHRPQPHSHSQGMPPEPLPCHGTPSPRDHELEGAHPSLSPWRTGVGSQAPTPVPPGRLLPLVGVPVPRAAVWPVLFTTCTIARE